MASECSKGLVKQWSQPEEARKSQSFLTSTPFTEVSESEKRLKASFGITSTTRHDSGLGASSLNITVPSPLECGRPTVAVTTCTPSYLTNKEQFSHQNFFRSTSPVSSKVVYGRRSLDSYFRSEDETQSFGYNDTGYSSSHRSRSRLSNSFEKCFVRKLDLDLDIYQNQDSPSPVSTPGQHANVLNDHFKNVLEKHSPPEPDRLIGRKMGLERVDILNELGKRNVSCVSTILSFLAPEDLCRMSMVSHEWERVVEMDTLARQRRKRFLKYHRDKKKEHGKENEGYKRSSIPASREGVVPLQDRHVTQPQIEQTRHSVRARNKTASEQFLQVASTLKNDEKLTKCPMCRKPAKVLPVQDRGQCQNPDCGYDYCVKCSYQFHHSKDCVPIVTKKTKTDAIGTKKGKKNLKRL